jgi:hypothetical protein
MKATVVFRDAISCAHLSFALFALTFALAAAAFFARATRSAFVMLSAAAFPPCAPSRRSALRSVSLFIELSPKLIL